MGNKIIKIAADAFNGTGGGGSVSITIAINRNLDASGNWIDPILNAPWRQKSDGSPDTTGTHVSWGTVRG